MPDRGRGCESGSFSLGTCRGISGILRRAQATASLRTRVVGKTWIPADAAVGGNSRVFALGNWDLDFARVYLLDKILGHPMRPAAEMEFG